MFSLLFMFKNIGKATTILKKEGLSLKCSNLENYVVAGE